MSEWFTRLILNLINLATVSWFAWIAIQHFRAGEDFWAALFFAVSVSWAVRRDEDRPRESA